MTFNIDDHTPVLLWHQKRILCKPYRYYIILSVPFIFYRKTAKEKVNVCGDLVGPIYDDLLERAKRKIKNKISNDLQKLIPLGISDYNSMLEEIFKNSGIYIIRGLFNLELRISVPKKYYTGSFAIYIKHLLGYDPNGS